MDSPVMNYMETNPWSLTNSNALAIVLMESTFIKLLAYRFSTYYTPTPLPFILTLIFYSLFNSLILLIQLMCFYSTRIPFLPQLIFNGYIFIQFHNFSVLFSISHLNPNLRELPC